MINQDEYWMQIALEEAQGASRIDEVPVGAAVVYKEKLLASAGNSPIKKNDPTAHAEINALRTACRLKNNYRLPGSTLYVTLEPCIMCLGAIIHTRIQRLVFGAYDPKSGAIVSCFQLDNSTCFNHKILFTGGILEDKCSHLLKQFFKDKRKLK